MPRDPGLVQIIAKKLGLITWPSFLERVCDTVAEKYDNGGWRGSKSLGDSFDVWIECYLHYLRTEGNHLVWLVGATYDQAHEEYGYIRDWSLKLGFEVQASNALVGPRTMTITWADHPGVVTVQTKSADDPTSLGSVAPSIILCCEAGQFSEDARDFIRGRTLTKSARIIWSGTFENDKGHAQMAWYEEESSYFWDNPTSRRHVYRMPTWENMALYGDCRDMLAEDPGLAEFCPDEDHGAAHSGMNHPKLRELHEIYKDQPLLWRKRYGGEPVGVQNPVYEWAMHDSVTDFSNNKYLVSMSEIERRRGKPNRWLLTTGGMDFGTVHPSAITIGSMNDRDELWVRHAVKDTSGSLQAIWEIRKVLTAQYHVRKWGRDPMVKHTPIYNTDDEAMTGGLFSRESRVGVVNGFAMGPEGVQHLYFNADDAGVVLLFREMQRVHRRRNANGQIAYVRDEDDMTASFEDMAARHYEPVLKLPKRWKLPALKPVAAAGYRSVS